MTRYFALFYIAGQDRLLITETYEGESGI